MYKLLIFFILIIFFLIYLKKKHRLNKETFYIKSNNFIKINNYYNSPNFKKPFKISQENNYIWSIYNTYFGEGHIYGDEKNNKIIWKWLSPLKWGGLKVGTVENGDIIWSENDKWKLNNNFILNYNFTKINGIYLLDNKNKLLLKQDESNIYTKYMDYLGYGHIDQNNNIIWYWYTGSPWEGKYYGKYENNMIRWDDNYVWTKIIIPKYKYIPQIKDDDKINIIKESGNMFFKNTKYPLLAYNDTSKFYEKDLKKNLKMYNDPYPKKKIYKKKILDIQNINYYPANLDSTINNIVGENRNAIGFEIDDEVNLDDLGSELASGTYINIRHNNKTHKMCLLTPCNSSADTCLINPGLTEYNKNKRYIIKSINDECTINKIDDIVETNGNDGTVSCDEYCNMGRNNEIEIGSKCLKAKIADNNQPIPCNKTSTNSLKCYCKKPNINAKIKKNVKNNGEISCNKYCYKGMNNESPKGSVCISSQKKKFSKTKVNFSENDIWSGKYDNCKTIVGEPVDCYCQEPINIKNIEINRFNTNKKVYDNQIDIKTINPFEYKNTINKNIFRKTNYKKTCENMKTFWNFSNATGKSVGKPYSQFRCRLNCSKDSDCDAYLINPNNQECWNYKINPGNVAKYSCGSPSKFNLFYGKIKSNIGSKIIKYIKFTATIDDNLFQVWADGKLVQNITGNGRNWQDLKTFYIPEKTKVIAISGSNNQPINGTGCGGSNSGGLSLRCWAKTGPWANFTANTSRWIVMASNNFIQPSNNGWNSSIDYNINKNLWFKPCSPAKAGKCTNCPGSEVIWGPGKYCFFRGYSNDVEVPKVLLYCPKTVGNSVYVLGNMGMGPWGGSSARYFNSNARWIWNIPNANRSAPANVSIPFIYQYCAPNNIKAIMYVIIDNTGVIYINNNKIANYGGGWTGNPGRFTIDLKKGLNDIKIIAQNLGNRPNPAGLIVSVFDESNNILFNTTSDWKIFSCNYKYNNYPKVIVLGNIGMGPWGGRSAKYFAPNAKWIWNTPGANNSASVNVKINFYYQYCSSVSVNAKIHVNIDNKGEIYVNNEKIANYGGGWGGDSGRFNIKIKKGINEIKIIAWNLGRSRNPAGLLVSAYDNSNNLLFKSDGSWKYY